jgi:hypothetical protein
MEVERVQRTPTEASMMNRILKGILCVALVLVCTSVVMAQGVQTATLIGTVRGADGSPLPGVTVTVTSPVLMGERSTITAETGEYVIRGLTPGAYTVTFALSGMVTVETKAELGLGVSQRADAELTSAVTEETIVVTAEAPAALDTVTVGSNFTATKVDHLPLTVRTPVAIAALSGGVTGGDRDLRTPVAGQLSINGGMAYDNSILINGVNVMDPIFGTANNLFIEDAVAETQVLTSGISAEYGAFTGGVLNVITKSGGNDFHGSLRANFSKPQWRDETPFEDARGTEREGDLSKNYAGTLGGRIIRDRLWFFAAGRDESLSNPAALPVTGINVDRVQDNTRYEAKLTANITARHSLNGQYIDNPQKSTHEIQVVPLELDAIGLDSERENSGYTIGYTGSPTDSIFAEARYSKKKFRFVGLGGTSREILDSPIRSSTRIPGNTAGTFNAPYFDATDPEDRNNDQLYGALSYFWTPASLGSHDFKLGAERFTVTRTGGNSQTSTGFVFYTGYQLSGTQPVLDSNGNLIPVFTSAANGRRGDDSRIGIWVPTKGAELDVTTDSVFFNDRWVLNDHFTFNLGVRWEQVNSEATGGISSIDTDNIVPRLGASFDPKGDGKYKFDVTYAEYAGRYNPSIVGADTVVGRPALLYGYYVGPNGSGGNFAPGFDPNNYVFYYASVPLANNFVADGLSSPVNTEYTLSAGMALGNGGFAKLTYVNRELSGVIDDFITIDNGCTDVVFQGVDAGCFDNIVYRNSDVPERDYQAVMLQGQYRINNNWLVEGNYTNQLKNEGNYEGEGGQSIGATPFGNRPETQSPRVNPSGRLSQYQEHKLRLWSIYNFHLGRAGDLGAGVIYRYDSPLTFSFSTSVPLSAAQRAANPGYQSLPTAQTLFFGDRGIGTFDATSLFDLTLTYSLPVFKSIEPWIKFDVTNVLNDDTVIKHNTGILANTGVRPVECGGTCPVDNLGLPTTFRPGATFGQATAATDHTTPREFFLGAGIRF